MAARVIFNARLSHGKCEGGWTWQVREGSFGDVRLDNLNFSGEIFYLLKEAQIVIEQWRVEHNTRRPHSALGYRPPAPAAYSPLVPPNSNSQPSVVM
jgi:hypothetical protein